MALLLSGGRMIHCYCGASWNPDREASRGKVWRTLAEREWWRHHGGPARPCLPRESYPAQFWRYVVSQ